MITINGQKMGKSLGNFITLNEFFNGMHSTLEQAYSPMTIRFFILQAHYGSTLDFSNAALIAAEKGMKKLFAAYELLDRLKPSSSKTQACHAELDSASLLLQEIAGQARNDDSVKALYQNCLNAMDDDFNSPIVIANLFEAVRIINQANDGTIALSVENIQDLKDLFNTFLLDILGMKPSITDSDTDRLDNKLMQIIIELRQKAKQNKDYATADAVREMLSQAGITLKDTKEGVEWLING